jgi:hypothetical protein
MRLAIRIASFIISMQAARFKEGITAAEPSIDQFPPPCFNRCADARSESRHATHGANETG